MVETKPHLGRLSEIHEQTLSTSAFSTLNSAAAQANGSDALA